MRGFRIELGEIESQMLSQLGVRQAVVVPHGAADQTRLVAYVVLDGSADVASLRERLLRVLPDYMVPAVIMPVERLPLNANGKLDRQALPKAEGLECRTHEPPQGPIETALAQIWSQVLGIARIGRQDNFFELGGDSILSLKVVGKAREQGISLLLKQLFQCPVLMELAASAAQSLANDGERQPSIPLADRSRPLVLSPAQMRQWFLRQLDRHSKAYHSAEAIRFTGKLDASALRAAFAALVERHESLRTIFHASAEGFVEQRVQSAGDFKLSVLDLRSAASEIREARAQEEARRIAHTPFDLTQGPLLRVGVIGLGDEDHVVVVVMHHIVSTAGRCRSSWMSLCGCMERRCRVRR